MNLTQSVALAAALLAFAAPARAADVTLADDTQKTIYALGLSVARNLAPFSLTEAELDILEAGIEDGALNRPAKAPLETFGPKIQALVQERNKIAAEAEKKAAAEFLEKAAAEKGAVKTASGLVFSETKVGSGPLPKAEDTVKVHYHGTLRDGSVFDSSVERKAPATFALNRVIPCWTEGVQKIHVGGKAKLVCPSSIAYGDHGAPPKIKPGAALVFEVELLEIVKQEAPAGAANKPKGAPAN